MVTLRHALEQMIKFVGTKSEQDKEIIESLNSLWNDIAREIEGISDFNSLKDTLAPTILDVINSSTTKATQKYCP